MAKTLETFEMKNALTTKSSRWKKTLILLAGIVIILDVILLALRYRDAQLSPLKNGSLSAKIIWNSSSVQNIKYPLRHSLSDDSIRDIKFLDPQALKENIKIVIIVLGDRPLDETTPTVDMVYRVLKGVKLARKFPNAILIMSGGQTAGPISEARMMGLIAWSRGVDPSRIILEDKSQTTTQNATDTANMIGSRNIQQVFIVTEKSRVAGAIKIFQKFDQVFKNIQGVACDVTSDLTIEQMRQYLMTHENRIVEGRLHYAERGIKSKAFNFAVIPEE
jgi:uncharacterized SAM-binding protein YcdF (DUF218 family)